jgi:type I restriction enzyme R subunit
MNEAQTRHDLIDPALKAAGWGVVAGSRISIEYKITKGAIIGPNKHKSILKADYVLLYKNKRIGLVEAKRRDLYYTEGVGQAKDYAQRLGIRYTYSTNGLQIYQMDMDSEGGTSEGDVARFPTPDELWAMTFPRPIGIQAQEINDWQQRFDNTPLTLYKGKYKPYYYQQNAIEEVLKAIANKRDRILLTMATGTGKTATAFHICWKLFESKWNLRRDGKRAPRILFLADRNILANQAFNSFIGFEEDALIRISPSEIRKVGHVPKNGNIFFTIFQTFMSGEHEGKEATEKGYFGNYPEDYFDLIIVDECHRGGANKESNWRGILDYFYPAVQLGLTATPKRKSVNIDTYRYFGEPVYKYSLREGINDGFLSPFRVKQIDTTIDNYTYDPDDDIEGEIDEERTYTETDFNRIIEIKGREKYRVKKFMDMINQDHKTLVFCSTQIHAAAIRDLINQYATSTNPDYCHRVTANDGKIGEQNLKYFQNNEKTIPTILTTSRKLSTGVDAPEVRNIVLLREVPNLIEFKQIVGRGTRLFDGKDYFTIYDFVNASERFKDDEWDGPPKDPEPKGTGVAPKVCKTCDERPCVCEKSITDPCLMCGNDPCTCHAPKGMIKVTLAAGKFLEIDSTVKTSFWSASGKPILAAEFIKLLYGELPSLFKDENELRKIWSLPNTRKQLLDELQEKGYSEAELSGLVDLVKGKNSDLFDVLNYIAYHKDLVSRSTRAQRAQVNIQTYNPKQQEFLNFVLDQYVKEGVHELNESKLPSLLELKYKALADAKQELGDIKSIRRAFIDFQAFLYRNLVG